MDDVHGPDREVNPLVEPWQKITDYPAQNRWKLHLD